MAQKADLFRSNVRRHVRLMGITFGELSKKAGISREYLSHMLSGRSSPTLDFCEKIAAALETSLEALLAEPQPQPLVPNGVTGHKIENHQEFAN